jgi:hypothetical protein
VHRKEIVLVEEQDGGRRLEIVYGGDGVCVGVVVEFDGFAG